jgi:drug/metabolite transporter (DMT)-like permease
VVCCALWGIQQVAVKWALPSVPPLLQAGIRSSGATLLVWLWARYRNVPLFVADKTLWPGIVAGTLFALEFSCIYLALPHTNASRVVVFVYTAPFVVAGALPLWVPSERLTRIQLVGLVCAFLALAYAFQEGLSLPTHEQLLGDSLALLAALFWGATTLVVRATTLSLAAPEKTLIYQLAVSSILLLAASAASGEAWPTQWQGVALASLAFQTVIVAFASYLSWFWLLRHYRATQLSAYTFLSPMFGLVFGAMLLGEHIGARLIEALAFVAIGIYLVSRKPTVSN